MSQSEEVRYSPPGQGPEKKIGRKITNIFVASTAAASLGLGAYGFIEMSATNGKPTAEAEHQQAKGARKVVVAEGLALGAAVPLIRRFRKLPPGHGGYIIG